MLQLVEAIDVSLHGRLEQLQVESQRQLVVLHQTIAVLQGYRGECAYS